VNSESITKKHYLNLGSVTEGKALWKILPAGVAMPKAVAKLRVV
jgi:hypothetical protein